MDDELGLTINGESWNSTRFNTTLFTFFGEAALYDHVFLEMGEENDIPQGAFLFSDHPAYHQLFGLIMENEFPMVLNRTEVPQCDIDAWRRDHLSDLGDSFPEEWEKE